MLLCLYNSTIYQFDFSVQNGHLASGVSEDRFLRSTPNINPKGSAPAKNVTIQIKITQICNKAVVSVKFTKYKKIITYFTQLLVYLRVN